MASRPKSICRKVACGKLLDAPGYCERHATQAVGWNRTNGELTSSQRGYDYRWQKKRELILKRDKGLCRCPYCDARPFRRIATEVDHIVSKKRAAKLGWSEDQIEADSNLQSINSQCHKRKTAEEEGKSYSEPAIFR